MLGNTDTPGGLTPPPGLQNNPTVAHPLTGELLEHLERQPPEVLADALAAVTDRQAALKEAGRQLEDELRRRLAIRERKQAQFGEYEVRIDGASESQWDPDDLELVLRNLVEQGAVQAGEVTAVIRHEIVVSRSEAAKVLGRLSGQARAAMEECRTWRQKTGRVRVTKSVPLIGAGGDA